MFCIGFPVGCILFHCAAIYPLSANKQGLFCVYGCRSCASATKRLSTALYSCKHNDWSCFKQFVATFAGRHSPVYDRHQIFLAEFCSWHMSWFPRSFAGVGDDLTFFFTGVKPSPFSGALANSSTLMQKHLSTTNVNKRRFISFSALLNVMSTYPSSGNFVC